MLKFLKDLFVVICIIVLLTVALFTYSYIDMNKVVTEKFGVYSEKIPPAFHNYKMMLISDFHNSDNYEKIAQKASEAKPNIIVIAGDMINQYDGEWKNVAALIAKLKPIAPIYFSSGNHEMWSQKSAEIIKSFEAQGVTILNNKATQITYKNNQIALIGFQDTIYADNAMRPETVEKTLSELSKIPENENLFKILLFHRANLADLAAKYPFDLILSGHLHGGQIDLPFIKDFILKYQNKYSKYVKGYYRIGESQLVVSGGLSKDLIEPRLFNTPQLVLITLKEIQD